MYKISKTKIVKFIPFGLAVSMNRSLLSICTPGSTFPATGPAFLPNTRCKVRAHLISA